MQAAGGRRLPHGTGIYHHQRHGAAGGGGLRGCAQVQSTFGTGAARAGLQADERALCPADRTALRREVQELDPPERTGARPGGLLPAESHVLCRQQAETGSASGTTEKGTGLAEESHPDGRSGAGQRGRGLHGAPPQRVHHAHGLPAQCLRG